MNILLVNPRHPDFPHISAVRAWRFAQELAKRGHHVVLLTVMPPEGKSSRSTAIVRHDWSSPLVLEVPSVLTVRSNSGIFARKIGTAWNLFWGGGSQRSWEKLAVESFLDDMPIKPEVVWCTFGQMEAVFVGRKIAGKLRVPWVLDVKDNWELFVPFGLRRLMVFRTNGASKVTSNAGFTAKLVEKWQRRSANIIYSGVHEAFFKCRNSISTDKVFTINIVGSLYFEQYLQVIMLGIQNWVDQVGAENGCKLLIRYLGGDTKKFSAASQRWAPNVRTEVLGYVSVEKLASYCCSCAANVYVGNKFTFHHKLLELLVCEKPIIVCPRESEESKYIVLQTGGLLMEASDIANVSARIHKVFKRWNNSVEQSSELKSFRHYGWPEQAAKLENIFRIVVEED